MLITQISVIFINMVFNNKFILASSSKSRFNILKNNKLSFTAIIPRCDEEQLKKKLIKKKTPIKKISLELARFKSQSISSLFKNKLVVGSDTMIDFFGKPLNKAKDLKGAKLQIKKISGKKHIIYSSASAFYNNNEVWKSTQKTSITIRGLSNQEIDKYLLSVGKNILSSVGCYQLEEMGPNIIESIKGDFFNVMGFPLFPFLKFIKEYKTL